MMRAWFFATALAKRYKETVPYLENNLLETWTHNKTIQKAIESFRISKMRFVNNLKPLVAFAEECGVTVGIEPVWQCPISSPQVMKRLLDDIPSDNLAVIFDLSNLMNRDVYLKQRQIMDDAFALFGDKIKVVHVKDFVIKEFDRAVPVFGTGLLDIKYLFSKIQELDTMPELIMDDMRLSDYDECTAFLRKLLSE